MRAICGTGMRSPLPKRIFKMKRENGESIIVVAIAGSGMGTIHMFCYGEIMARRFVKKNRQSSEMKITFSKKELVGKESVVRHLIFAICQKVLFLINREIRCFPMTVII